MKHRPLHETFFLTRVFGILFWIGILFLPHRSVLALGLYSPTITLGEVEAGEDYAGTFRVVREVGEVGTGSLSVDVEITGDQWIVVTGEESFVMSASENAYDYTFLFSPNAAYTGDYQTHFVFFLEPSGSHDGGAGAFVREGLEGILTYHMTTSSETGAGSVSSGQGTSSSTTTQDDEEDSSDQEDIIEEGDEEGVQSDESQEQTEVSEESGEETIWTGDEREGESESLETSESMAQESQETSGSDEVDFEDVSDLFEVYGSTGCGSIYDLDRDGIIGLSDLSLLVSRWTSDEGRFTGWPPIEPGEPLTEDAIIFKFQVAHADRKKFSVILSSARKTADDEVAMYVLVDTGQGGVNTADLVIDYDTEQLQFIDAELEGSIFSIFRSKPQEIENGKISLTTATLWPFVGTNGFVATLYFSLIAKGEAALRFDKIEAYGEEAYEPEQVLGTDLIGMVDKKSASTDMIEEEYSMSEQIPSYFFQINFLEIILLLILLMDTIALWILYRDTKDQKYV